MIMSILTVKKLLIKITFKLNRAMVVYLMIFLKNSLMKYLRATMKKLKLKNWKSLRKSICRTKQTIKTVLKKPRFSLLKTLLARISNNHFQHQIPITSCSPQILWIPLI